MQVKLLAVSYQDDAEEDIQNLADQGWTPVSITMYDPENSDSIIVLLTKESLHEEI